MSSNLNPAQQEKALKLELRLAQIAKNEGCQLNFLDFVRSQWPEFIAGRHHKIIAEKLERVASGELKRLIINMAPRHTKSEFASFLFPAWMMGKNPSTRRSWRLTLAGRRRIFWTWTVTRWFSLKLS